MFSNGSGVQIANQMRRNNYEKFKTLVRMHLSFEIDLNTDEFDLPCHDVVYFDKGKQKKWNRLSKKVKSCTSGKNASSPLEETVVALDDFLIIQLKKLKSLILLDNNVKQEGIFRKTGSVSRQNELRSAMEKDIPFDQSSGYSVHDYATVYKSFLSDLHEPVLTHSHYPAHLQIAPLCNAFEKTSPATGEDSKELHLLRSVQLLLLLLPTENRILLQDIIEMLNVVALHKDCNKMPSENLATLFAPHLICPRSLPPEALHHVAQTMSPIINFMITKGLVIFDVPEKLATDIRAYLLEQKRKQNISPEQMLDESISDISTVNTVYTFVDREKTAAAHNANNTDTELAQLYAHIQSLPESSKKRRLIKQFNKQNGQGTPLQLLSMNRFKQSEPSRSAKSISDSIKRHIFHKSIVSRTPKRSTVLSYAQTTPNIVKKNVRHRVLFQSPISNASSTNNISGMSPSSSSSFYACSNHLKKSISSTSLQLTPLSNGCRINKPLVTNNTVSDLVNQIYSNEPDSGLCTTPLGSSAKPSIVPSSKLSTDKINKENQAWGKTQSSNVLKPNDLLKTNKNQIEFKSRYKSEPNLSQVLSKNMSDHTPAEKGKSLSCKLIKGVSMGNLRFAFAPPELSRNLILPVLLPNLQSSKDCISFQEENEFDSESDLDDEDHVGNGGKNIRSAIEVSGETDVPQVSVYRSIDLRTSTPSSLLSRRSMSPITKSTQRMPKAMQESIMTPRSRKPVMLTTTQRSSEQNQIFYQSDPSSFREEDEYSFSEHPPNKIKYAPLKMSPNKEVLQRCSLSNNFKEYLLKRSVLTASPADSSFSSQPDDFGSRHAIEDIDESQLSSSLLYCLNGNCPVQLEESDGSLSNDSINHTGSNSNTTSRKRSTIKEEENEFENSECSLVNKKLLITDLSSNSEETSF